jgi:uncharacterized protein
VDSAVLLALAVEALGAERVVAATGLSASLARADLDDARLVARRLGVRHHIVKTREMESPAYRANDGSRCFHCRNELFSRLKSVAAQAGLTAIAYGAIVDDLGDERPGMRAAADHGAIAPLLDAGLSKSDVRALAAEAGILVGQKPAAACLSSRIPVGSVVTPEKLARIERAEAALRRMGFGQLRVRHHADVARLELDPGGERMLADAVVRAAVVREIQEAGFRFVALDLEGYRTGPKRDGGQ